MNRRRRRPTVLGKNKTIGRWGGRHDDRSNAARDTFGRTTPGCSSPKAPVLEASRAGDLVAAAGRARRRRGVAVGGGGGDIGRRRRPALSRAAAAPGPRGQPVPGPAGKLTRPGGRGRQAPAELISGRSSAGNPAQPGYDSEETPMHSVILYYVVQAQAAELHRRAQREAPARAASRARRARTARRGRRARGLPVPVPAPAPAPPGS